MEKLLTTAIGRWRALKLIQYTARFVLLLATPKTVPVTRDLYVVAQSLHLSAEQKALLTKLALHCSLQKRVLSLGNGYKPLRAILAAGVDALVRRRERKLKGGRRSRKSLAIERLTRALPRDHTFPDLLAAQLGSDDDDEDDARHDDDDDEDDVHEKSPGSGSRGSKSSGGKNSPTDSNRRRERQRRAALKALEANGNGDGADLVHSEHILARPPSRIESVRWLLVKALALGEDLSEDIYTLAQLGYLPPWLTAAGAYADRCWLASLLLELHDWGREKRLLIRRRRMNALLAHRDQARRDEVVDQAEFWHDLDGLKICCDLVQATCDVFEFGSTAVATVASQPAAAVARDAGATVLAKAQHVAPAGYGVRDFVTVCALTSSVLGMYKFVAKP